jgi:hypothetical protein
MILGAGNIVKARNVAMNALVDSKQAEEVCRWCQGRCAAFAFPKGCAEVVSLGKNRAFGNVKAVGDGVEVNEPPGKFEV